MAQQHLTISQLEEYLENQTDRARRATIERHLAGCAACRARMTQRQMLDTALRKTPRETPPHSLDDLIIVAVDWRMRQEQGRRDRFPFVALATLFSAALTLWFGAQVVVAFQENGVMDFWSLYTSHAEVSYSPDALLAFIEALPFYEIALTLFALITAGVLAQQLIETFRPSAVQFK